MQPALNSAAAPRFSTRSRKVSMFIVTGGAGFIGSNIVKLLNDKGTATNLPI